MDDKVDRVKMRHHAKYRGDRSNLCPDKAIFQFYNMAAVAILDF